MKILRAFLGFIFPLYLFVLSGYFLNPVLAAGELCSGVAANCCVAPQPIIDGGGCASGQVWIGDVLTGYCQTPVVCGSGRFLCYDNSCYAPIADACTTSDVDTGANMPCCADGQIPVRAGTGWTCSAGPLPTIAPIVNGDASHIATNDTIYDFVMGQGFLTSSTQANGFSTMNTSSGSNPVADSATDTLTFIAGTGITVTGNSGSDTITIANTVTAQDFEGVYATDANKILTASANFATAVTGTTDFDTTGAFSINSSGGVINVGNDAVAQAINVGTGTAARTITVGNATTTTALNLTSGSGAINLNANNNQPTNIGTGSSTGTITIGGGTGAKTVSIGNAVGGTSVGLYSGNGGGALQLNYANGSAVTNIGGGGTTGLINIGVGDTSPVNINTGASTGTVTIGGGSGTVVINSSDWDISSTGAMTGFSFDANGTGNSITNIESADILDGTIVVADVSTSSIQARVSGTCSTGSSIRVINENGTVACETDDTSAAPNLFQTINAPSGTDPVADSTTDTLNFTAGTGISITGNSSTDTITIATTGGGGSGTVIETHCSWVGSSGTVGSCTPPTCPSGWTDLGTGNMPLGAGDSSGINSDIVGTTKRGCYSTSSFKIFTATCSWMGSSGGLSSCTPPTCPSGWTDLGTGNLATASDNGLGTNNRKVGYGERICSL